MGSRWRNRGNTQPTPPVCKSKRRHKVPHGPPSGCTTGVWPSGLNFKFLLFPIGGGPTSYTITGFAPQQGLGPHWTFTGVTSDGMTYRWDAEIQCFNTSYFIDLQVHGGALPGPIFFVPATNWAYDYGPTVVMPARDVPYSGGFAGWQCTSGAQT